MIRGDRRTVLKARSTALLAGLVACGAATFASAGSSGAQTPGVSGEAYGHYTKVGLFGGPQGVVGPAPQVILPSTGSDGPITGGEPDGASAVYGPATIFGGKWPLDLGTAPKSGPVSVSTQGTPGPGGSVTSTASITLHPKPVPVTCDGHAPGTKSCTSPGGFGPVVPNEGDELHATCTANAQGVSGSARFVNATLSTSTDEGGEPKDREPIPDNPPPNYTRTGVITNVGDKWKIVYNEQFIDADGSLTVNALHMYLLGDIAVGEQILGHVRCSMKPAETSATTALSAAAAKKQPPTAPAAAPAGSSAGDINNEAVRSTKAPSESTGNPALLFVAVGAVPALGLAAFLIRSRRRRGRTEQLADGPQPDPVG